MPRFAVLALLLAAGPVHAAPIDFRTQVRPLLQKHCVSCHGPTKQKAGLKLDSGTHVRKGGLNGPVVVPGKSADSRLMHALKGTGDLEQMPPAGPLPDADIQLLARWIDEGASVPAEEVASPPHWAFVPPKASAVPDGVNPIDLFLQQEWTKRQLTPAPAADPATLVRRLHLDLTGLPPTPAEVQSFRVEEFEKRLDALLASPAHGERWGRHFLDVWRYSDWYGYGNELRNSQKHIWHWRDWVVESLNANAPYDRMVREMLAGDEIAPADPKVLRATGYLARSYYKFNRNVWLDDIVEHTGKAFLGITLNCCRCHDHMYDPLPQADYYRFRAIFEPHQLRADSDAGPPRAFDADPAVKTFLFERGDDKRPVTDKPLPPGVPVAVGGAGFVVSEVKLPFDSVRPTLRPAVRDDLLNKAEAAVREAKTPARVAAAVLHRQAVRAKLDADRARFATPPAPHTAELIRHAVALHVEAAALAAEAELAETPPANAAAAKAKVDAARAACGKPPADYPPLLPPGPATSTGRRLALANWITSPENPLTARVFVNHVWMRHFGQPLVPTVFDFGKNGRPASHPALLDHLAVEFVRSGWDVKQLHRRMLTSRAYRMQSTLANEGNRKLDPDNVCLWRMNPRPLEAEAVRDSLLAVSGLLDPKRGGPDLDHIDTPPFRRSLYYRHAPEKQMPFLAAFDGPSPTECYRRATTVVPQQALALVNSPVSARAAETVAKGLPTNDPPAAVRAVFLKVLGRPPTDAEAGLCVEYLKTNPPAALVQAVFNHADFAAIR